MEARRSRPNLWLFLLAALLVLGAGLLGWRLAGVANGEPTNGTVSRPPGVRLAALRVLPGTHRTGQRQRGKQHDTESLGTHAWLTTVYEVDNAARASYTRELAISPAEREWLEGVTREGMASLPPDYQWLRDWDVV